MSGIAPKAIVIGASAGAVEALNALLPTLPASYPLPVMVVVHIPPDKESLLPELFQQKCAVRVCEAEDKQTLQAGHVYFSPPNYHLLVEENNYLSLSNEDPVRFSRPSIDVLFETAADAYGEALVGIVLTGANEDGAEGLKAITDAGGIAIVQEPTEAFANTMPLAARTLSPQAQSLRLKEIAAYLQEIV